MKAYAEYEALPLFVSVLWSPLVFCKTLLCFLAWEITVASQVLYTRSSLSQSSLYLQLCVVCLKNVTCLSHKQEMTLVGGLSVAENLI